ncbi:MAG TPA: hypothetical protein VEI03_10650 [Stellaceae bacterium]|nr:hypothetical protein [Stellaceae bacterium]
MNGFSGALTVAALALIGKVIYDIWTRWQERRSIAAALAGEIGAYLALIRPAEIPGVYRRIATLDREQRLKALRAMPSPPPTHPVFDKVAHKIGLLSADEAREISAFYNIVTGFRIHVSNFSTDKFLEAPDQMHVGILNFLAQAVEDEAPKAAQLVARLRQTADKGFWSASVQIMRERAGRLGIAR